MKHPTPIILQDYFENALPRETEDRVREHLESCDECTGILSDFMVIEARLKKLPVSAVPRALEQKIFASAGRLLTERRRLVREKDEKVEEFLREWREKVFIELKVPALQLSSLSLVAAMLVAIEMSQVEEIHHVPIDSGVHEFTSEEK